MAKRKKTKKAEPEDSALDAVLDPPEQEEIEGIAACAEGFSAVWFDVVTSRRRLVPDPQSIIVEPVAVMVRYVDDDGPRVGGLVAGYGGLQHPEDDDNFRGYISDPRGALEYARGYCKKLQGDLDDEEDDEDEDDDG